MVIYKITNTITDQNYIGQTVVRINKRWDQHRSSKKITPLYASFKKYGVENFTFEILCSATSPAYLNELEVYFIKFYSAEHPIGFNLTSGGDSAYYRSEDTKIKQRLAKIGHVVSAATKRKISMSLTGRPGIRGGSHHSDATKSLISSRQAGKKVSEDTRRKQSESHKGSKAYNSKSVQCIETGVIYGSTGEASRQIGAQQTSISAVCNGKRRSTKGLTFRFIT